MDTVCCSQNAGMCTLLLVPLSFIPKNLLKKTKRGKREGDAYKVDIRKLFHELLYRQYKLLRWFVPSSIVSNHLSCFLFQTFTFLYKTHASFCSVVFNEMLCNTFRNYSNFSLQMLLTIQHKKKRFSLSKKALILNLFSRYV